VCWEGGKGGRSVRKAKFNKRQDNVDAQKGGVKMKGLTVALVFQCNKMLGEGRCGNERRFRRMVARVGARL